MKALLLREYKQFEVADLPVPAIGPQEVLVQVRACGICGSDVHGMDGSSGRRIPPLVMGHEAAGIVTDVGSEVQNFQPGDRVTFDSTVYCGRCRFCRQGAVNLCDERQVLGVSCAEYRRQGALAEYVAVPARIVYKLPQKMPFTHASMAEPVSIAAHAVQRAAISAGDTAVVVGAGMIGLLIIQVLRLAGCGRIVAVDLNAHRLALACRLGANEGLNGRDVEAPAVVRAQTNGRGADVVFEVVGLPPAVQTAVACARKGGTVALVGNLAPQVELALQAVVSRELNLVGSCASAGEYPRSLELIGLGKINVEALISAVAPLADGPQWFERLYVGEEGLMKVILEP